MTMSHSIVVCSDCGEANTAVEWGFVLLAREGWTAQLSDNGRDPEWRCPACNAKLSDLETWDANMNDAQAQRPRLRILLVDDQVMVLRATASMLRELDVVTTGSAAEALGKLARGSHFDVVVSDVTMPGMSGPELFVRIRERHPHLAERVLLVSGDAYAAERMCSAVARRERISNMPRILHKPVPRDELVRAIEDLGQRRVGRSGTFSIDPDSQRVRANTK
jgi:CheY-like chemotaxis protein